MDETWTQPIAIAAPEAPKPRLVVWRSPVKALIGQELEVGPEPVVVGRATDAQLRLSDPGTSRRHVRVEPVPGGFEVVDLGSTNGTFVNGRRVMRERLREGDRIQVGSLTVLRFTERESDHGIDRALAIAGVALFEWSMGHQRLVSTDNLAEVVGLDPAVLTGDPRALLRHVAPGSRLSAEAAFGRLLAGRDPLELELEVLEPSGPRWLSIKAEVLRDQEGVPLFVVGTVLDLSAQRRATAQLKRKTQLFERLFDAAVLTDTSGRIADWSGTAEKVFGLGREAALGRPLAALGTCADPAATTEAMLDSVVHSGRWSGELTLARGKVLEAVTVALPDDDGRETAYLTAFRDITERKRLDARLLLNDRMASVGTLAAGVAHEINNPLSFIRANLVFLQEELASYQAALPQELRDEVQKVFVETQEGARRIEVIIRDLKTFSRSDERSEVEAVNVKAMLGFALKMVDNHVRHRAQLELDLPEGLFVRGVEARLGQVFVNLLVNAAQAIPDGDARHHAIRVRARAEGDQVVIEVSDTGKGMSPEVKARIFNPFFTTKRVGEGTGLGLAVSHAIVTAVGGEICVESEPGRGTTFRVRLKAAPDPAVRAITPPPVRPSKPLGGARVLVIDDDALVASALRRVLAVAHQVTIVNSGAEALSLLQSHAFDVMLCDLMMPDVSGMDLYVDLAARRPELLQRLVFVTGGAFTPRAEEFLAQVKRPVVRKPFDRAELLELVQRTLDEQGVCSEPLTATFRSA